MATRCGLEGALILVLPRNHHHCSLCVCRCVVAVYTHHVCIHTVCAYVLHVTYCVSARVCVVYTCVASVYKSRALACTHARVTCVICWWSVCCVHVCTCPRRACPLCVRGTWLWQSVCSHVHVCRTRFPCGQGAALAMSWPLYPVSGPGGCPAGPEVLTSSVGPAAPTVPRCPARCQACGM